jgi:hypothetical protein
MLSTRSRPQTMADKRVRGLRRNDGGPRVTRGLRGAWFPTFGTTAAGRLVRTNDVRQGGAPGADSPRSMDRSEPGEVTKRGHKCSSRPRDPQRCPPVYFHGLKGHGVEITGALPGISRIHGQFMANSRIVKCLALAQGDPHYSFADDRDRATCLAAAHRLQFNSGPPARTMSDSAPMTRSGRRS